MKVVDFSHAHCKRVEGLLDAYVSGELLVETAQDVERHAADCETCGALLENLEGLRRAVRRAALAEAVPPGLDDRVRRRVERDASGARTRRFWLAAVAALVLSFGAGWMASLAFTGHPPHRYIANEYAIHQMLRGVDGVFRLGLGTHAHCAYYRPEWKDELPAEEIVRELGEYAPLSDVVREEAPEGFELLVAHRCDYLGHEYLHFALKGDGGLISLILTTPQDGDAYAEEFAVRTAGGFEAVGFSAAGYVGFVVSDLGDDGNLRMARAFRGRVGDVLRGIEG